MRLMICTPDGGERGIPLEGTDPFVRLTENDAAEIRTTGSDGNIRVRALVKGLPWYVVVAPPPAEGSAEEDADERPSKPGETF